MWQKGAVAMMKYFAVLMALLMSLAAAGMQTRVPAVVGTVDNTTAEVEAESGHSFEYSVGLGFGNVSLNASAGDSARESFSTLGAQILVQKPHFGFGIQYAQYSKSEGTSIVSIEQKNDLVLAEARWRPLDWRFNPFVALGGGAAHQSLKTTLYSEEESVSGWWAATAIGLGIEGHLTSWLSLEAGARYVQFNNYFGWLSGLSARYVF
jgi:opacity protein-like surface antigen